MGTLVVFPFPKNVQLMTSGILGGEKVRTSFFFPIFVRAFSCPCLHDSFCRLWNQKRRNKNTFKERVEFPILECSGRVGETKQSRIVVGRVRRVVTAMTQCVDYRCVLSLISLAKPMKTFAREDSEDISLELNILFRRMISRHEWHFITIPVEGVVRLPFMIPLTGETSTAAHWISPMITRCCC